MLEEMPFGALLEWMAFDSLEPLGGRRGDWQAASICSTVANTAAARSGSRKRFMTKDFLLEFGAERQVPVVRKSWQEMKMMAMMIAAASNEPAAKKRKK